MPCAYRRWLSSKPATSRFLSNSPEVSAAGNTIGSLRRTTPDAFMVAICPFLPLDETTVKTLAAERQNFRAQTSSLFVRAAQKHSLSGYSTRRLKPLLDGLDRLKSSHRR